MLEIVCASHRHSGTWNGRGDEAAGFRLRIRATSAGPSTNQPMTAPTLRITFGAQSAGAQAARGPLRLDLAVQRRRVKPPSQRVAIPVRNSQEAANIASDMPLC